MVFDRLQVNSSFKNARFAAEFVIVSQESKFNNQSFTVHSKKSLDDEHTPGIFEIVEVASPKSFMAREGKIFFLNKIFCVFFERLECVEREKWHFPSKFQFVTRGKKFLLSAQFSL